MNPPTLPLEAQALRELALAYTRNGLRQGAKASDASGLIRRIDLALDEEIVEAQRRSPTPVACKKGCCFCCESVVPASLPEVVAAYEHVESTFSDTGKRNLAGRLDGYEREMADRGGRMRRPDRIRCPMLIDGECSIYEARPLSCRAACSFDAGACEAALESPEAGFEVPFLLSQMQLYQSAYQGLARGLASAQIDSKLYEFGRCIKLLLDEPGMVDEVLAGRAELPHMAAGEPPTNFPSKEGEAFGLVGHSTRSPVADAFAELKVPAIYESEEQIEEALETYGHKLDRLLEMEFDPVEAFNAECLHQTFNLAYTGRSVRPYLEKHGRILVEKIAHRALPHLSEPLGARRPGKIRLGYISALMTKSNACSWALGWLENHGDEFETYAFNVGAFQHRVSLKFEEAADRYFHLTGSVQAAAEFIRDLDLDVLIFTDIGMHFRSLQFASLRLARIQCTAWGHPVTSGLSSIDYYLSSDFMEPEGAVGEYSEKLVRLPRSGLCYRRRKYGMGERGRSHYGLPEGFLPLMGQYLLKWLPGRDELIKAIGENIGGPVAILLSNQPEWNRVFEERMKRIGARVIFVPQQTSYEYDLLLKSVDVSFDPPDWSGGNTTIEALNLGTPVATLPGQFMRGRHSAAFHRIAGTPGLIATDEGDFINLVCDRDRLRAAMASAEPDALFDDKAVVSSLDSFLLEALERHD